MIANLVAFILPNAYLLACQCCTGFYYAIGWSAFTRWTCWNTVRPEIAKPCILKLQEGASANGTAVLEPA